MDLDRMIFITGFPRSGMGWLSECVTFHPDATYLPHDMPLLNSPDSHKSIEQVVLGLHQAGQQFVHVATEAAPHLEAVCHKFFKSKFLFLVRDPRDVLVSHARCMHTSIEKKFSSVAPCMQALKTNWESYQAAAIKSSSIMVVYYEDLHQTFENTLAKVYDFLGFKYDESLLREAFEQLNFRAQTGRRLEDRSALLRKGVINDWVNYLCKKDTQWLKTNRYWSRFLTEHSYTWETTTYSSILQAMLNAGVHSLTQEDLLTGHINFSGANVLLLHDIDLLSTKQHRESVLETADCDAQAGFSSFFNFLPLDDQRYKPLTPTDVISLIKQVLERHPAASIGLHLNAAEKFFSLDMPDIGEDHPDMVNAIAYLHEQIDGYERFGFHFKIATAHGYGRRKKRPNNRDSPVFTEELLKRGIYMYDNILRTNIKKKAQAVCNISDVGGSLGLWGLGGRFSVDDKRTYNSLPAGTLILMLSHPGNYSMQRPLTVGFRDSRFVRKR